MTLAEGKYHQVKRMVSGVSNRVEGLKRIQIGELKLPEDLAVGEWRWLSEGDMIKLNRNLLKFFLRSTLR
jgi:16S rRNA pseudouridine516 synthase